MVRNNILLLFGTAIVAACLMSEFHYSAAARPLGGEMIYSAVATLQSSLKGTVPSHGNPCTNIPNKGSGTCNFVEDKDFAGSRRAAHPPPSAYHTTDASVSSGMASLSDETSNHKDH